jgi:glycerol-3-phosphate O-acyltransferase
MPIGEWQPENSAQQTTIDTEKLEALIAISQRGELLELADQLGDDDQQWLAFSMHAVRDTWLQAADALSNDKLVHLMKALAIAEMNIPGCSVAEKSPVIYLNRLLKQRGDSLMREDLLWIKQHSNNRFLPNGPVL